MFLKLSAPQFRGARKRKRSTFFHSWVRVGDTGHSREFKKPQKIIHRRSKRVMSGRRNTFYVTFEGSKFEPNTKSILVCASLKIACLWVFYPPLLSLRATFSKRPVTSGNYTNSSKDRWLIFQLNPNKLLVGPQISTPEVSPKTGVFRDVYIRPYGTLVPRRRILSAPKTIQRIPVVKRL